MYNLGTRRKFLTMREQQRKEDMLKKIFPRGVGGNRINSTRTCPPLKVVVYGIKNKSIKSRPGDIKLNKTLPQKPIERHHMINNALGAKMYPETRVVYKFLTDMNEADRLVAPLESRMFQECQYADEIANMNKTDFARGNHITVAYMTYERIRNVAVAACSWKIDSWRNKRAIEIKYLCSSKMCSGAGTSIMYAMEEVAKALCIDTIRLIAAASSKPFYFKIGLEYDAPTSTISTMELTTNTTNTEQSIRFPSRTSRRMKKRIRLE